MKAATSVDGEGITSIVDYLYEFALLELEEQRIILKEWIKYGEWAQMMLKRADRRRVYLLPGSGFLICKDALCKLLGMGHTAWTIITKTRRRTGRLMSAWSSGAVSSQISNRRWMMQRTPQHGVSTLHKHALITVNNNNNTIDRLEHHPPTPDRSTHRHRHHHRSPIPTQSD
jgi:hypothetical protein